MGRMAFSLLATLTLCGSISAAAEDRIAVAHDSKKGKAAITIRARKGKVSWGDVLRALARAKGLDDSALAGVLPDSAFDLNEGKTRMAFLGLTLALSPGMRFRVLAPSGEKQEPVLRIVLSRKALLISERRLKERLRRAILRRRKGNKRFGLDLDKGWPQAPADAKLVILLHGLHSSPRPFESFRRQVRKQGFPTGTLRYPNDQSLDASARLLAAELHKVAQQDPSRRVALVAHSMGGLVCRAVIEDPELDPGNVCRLIMAGTPNQGSRLAEFAFGVEFWEHISKVAASRQTKRFYAAIEDGFGEAYGDLAPDSDFLKRLNARPRNPRVTYTIFLGSGGFVTEHVLSVLRANLKKAGSKNRFVRLLGPRVDEALAGMDEVKPGRGDGAVAVENGLLAGVTDVVILPVDHLAMIRSNLTKAQKRLRIEIIKRLTSRGQSPPAAKAPD